MFDKTCKLDVLVFFFLVYFKNPQFEIKSSFFSIHNTNKILNKIIVRKKEENKHFSIKRRLEMSACIVAFPANNDNDIYIDNDNESRRSSIKKRRSTKIIPLSDVSQRLNKRKQLHNQR